MPNGAASEDAGSSIRDLLKLEKAGQSSASLWWRCGGCPRREVS